MYEINVEDVNLDFDQMRTRQGPDWNYVGYLAVGDVMLLMSHIFSGLNDRAFSFVRRRESSTFY